MSFPYNTLESEEARSAFRAAYRSAVLQDALTLTHSQQEAERLTAQAFKRMEQRYRSTPLPSGIELMLLAQVNLIYAQGAYGRTDKASQDIAEPQPTPLTPAAPLTAPRTASAMPSRNVLRARREARSAQEEQLTQSAKTDQPPQAFPSAQPSLPSQAQCPEQPPQPQSAYAAQPMYPMPYPAPPMLQPTYPVMQSYPYASSPYYSPTVSPPQYGFQPIVTNAMPVVMMPYCPAQSITLPPQQPIQAAEPPAASPQAPAEKEPESRKEAYDPSVTELWAPDDAVAEQAAPIERKSAPQQPTASVEPPSSATPSINVDFDEETNQRSIPLTILNTFLFIGLIGSVVFLLMQLNVLPRLI